MAETGRNLHHMVQLAREGQCNWTSTPKTALGILSKYTVAFQELLILCPNTAVNKTKIAQAIYQCHIDGGEVSKLATFSKDDADKVGEVIRITLIKLRKCSADEKQQLTKIECSSEVWDVYMCLRVLTSSYEGFDTEFLESLFFGCFESLRGLFVRRIWKLGFQRTCSMATQHEIQMLRSLLGSVHYNDSQAYPLHVTPTCAP